MGYIMLGMSRSAYDTDAARHKAERRKMAQCKTARRNEAQRETAKCEVQDEKSNIEIDYVRDGM